MTINTTKIADEGKAREMMRGIAAGVRFTSTPIGIILPSWPT